MLPISDEEMLVGEFQPSEGMLVRIYTVGGHHLELGDIRYALADCIAMDAELTSQMASF